VSVGRTALRATSGLVSAAVVEVKSRGDERTEQLALADLLRRLLLVHHLPVDPVSTLGGLLIDWTIRTPRSVYCHRPSAPSSAPASR
jgi:hypothetical protein